MLCISMFQAGRPRKGEYSGLTRGGSRFAATSKMELFVIIVNGFQPLTIITKSSILDVAAVLDPPLLTNAQKCKLRSENLKEKSGDFMLKEKISKRKWRANKEIKVKKSIEKISA